MINRKKIKCQASAEEEGWLCESLGRTVAHIEILHTMVCKEKADNSFNAGLAHATFRNLDDNIAEGVEVLKSCWKRDNKIVMAEGDDEARGRSEEIRIAFIGIDDWSGRVVKLESWPLIMMYYLYIIKWFKYEKMINGKI